MNETMAKIKQKAKQIKRDIFMLVEANKHPRVPWYVKLLSILIVAYTFSPIDLIPDFIPVLGYLDEIILVPLAISLVLKLIPSDVLEEIREIVRKSDNVKKKNWTAGMIIVLIWIAVLYWIASLFF
ncbi:YkvA family protein [Metabacillus fastidiosus]|uniref:YkvA family protein n=1 Tax=Metabacillus fastidiosus TaxID=1458 RepID=UPI003D2A8AB4